MNLKNVLTGIMLCLTASSCIQDEALNIEAAIDGCDGSNIQLSTINTDNKSVTIYVSKSTDLSALEINFLLPEGASIRPVKTMSGDNAPQYNFNLPGTDILARDFRVTSESGTTEAVYTITIMQSELPTEYSFEEIDNSGLYHEFFELDLRKAEMLQWASGNPGFRLTGMAKLPSDYPTVQSEGYHGKGVKLETKNTGSFGATVSMPIAAGNLFIGSFEIGNALKDAPKATKFGFPFYKHPTRLSGYYKFKSGEDFTSYTLTPDGKKKFFIDPEMKGKDKGDIYAVLYNTDNTDDFLDGYNSLTSEKIISIARIPTTEETDEWKLFDIPFEYKKGINDDDLKTGKYKLAIVFSSSIEGADFKGSVGSTLWIDEVTIHCEEDNK